MQKTTLTSNLKAPFPKKIQLKYLLLIGGTMLLFSCQSSREEETQERLFQAQTRLLNLEKHLQHKTQASSKRTKALSLNAAESEIRQNAYETNLQSIKGELDTFRHFLGLKDLKADELDNLRLDNRLVSMRKNTKDLEKVNERMKRIEERQKEILKHLEKIAKSKLASASTQKTKAKASTKKSKINSLTQANRAFRTKHYTQLTEELPELIKKKKATQRPPLQFLYAESLYNLGRVNEAALAYDGLLKTTKNKRRLRKVYLRMGDCFRRMGDSKTATIYYEELIEKYPKAREAMAASSQLSKLKKKKS